VPPGSETFPLYLPGIKSEYIQCVSFYITKRGYSELRAYFQKYCTCTYNNKTLHTLIRNTKDSTCILPRTALICNIQNSTCILPWTVSWALQVPFNYVCGYFYSAALSCVVC